MALTTTLALAAACWVVAVDRMDGMDMVAATELGSFAFSAAAWVPMMAAMMLPGAAPAVVRSARSYRPAPAVPLFVGSYLAVWGLMVMLVAVGVMSVTWMATVGVVILAQKLAPPVAAVDVPLALVSSDSER